MRAISGLRRGLSSHAGQKRSLVTAELPDLPYEYGALEPKISGQIMEIHHSKHHATYVAGLNAAGKELEQAEQAKDVKKIITLEKAINFNGGGHLNHSLFWKNLCPAKEYEPPAGDLKAAIEKQFGGLDGLKKQFNPAAAAIQGSGWAWLGYNPTSKSLAIATTPNQDILDKQGLTPLLGVDMWEHAFYLQYKNVKPDYLNAIWDVINWREVAKRYEGVASS